MLTERMQARAIWRLTHTDDDLSDIKVEEFDEPWRTVYEIADAHLRRGSSQSDALTAGVTRGASGGGQAYWKDVHRILAVIEAVGDNAAVNAGFISYQELAVTLPPVAWLWEPWIPRGMLSLLGAWQGTGKSWLALDLARIVTQSDAWPDGSAVGRTGPCIYVEAEAVPRITVDRIRAMGLDASNIYPFLPDRFGLMDLVDRGWQDRLTDMADQIRPELIIIDSLTNVSEAGQNSVEDVKNLLMYFVRLADFADCGLVVIHHLRKPAGGQLAFPGVSIHDFRGSGHITAMARTVLGLSVVQAGKQFSLNGPRRLELAKTNLGPYPTALGVEIVDVGGRTQFVYGEAPDAGTTQRQDCGEWLIEYLETEGPSKPKDVVKAAEAEGYKRGMLFEARKEHEARIINTKGHKHPQNRWMLVEIKSLESEESEESEESGEFAPSLASNPADSPDSPDSSDSSRW